MALWIVFVTVFQIAVVFWMISVNKAIADIRKSEEDGE